MLGTPKSASPLLPLIVLFSEHHPSIAATLNISLILERFPKLVKNKARACGIRI
jgi:hypothetical protein